VEYRIARYDHYATMQYIGALKFWLSVYTQCVDNVSHLPWQWAQYLTGICRIGQFDYRVRVDMAEWTLSFCGGQRNWSSGFYMAESFWRYGWWWLGWHYSSWHQLSSFPIGCWNS
jgi:hypothetical protein